MANLDTGKLGWLAPLAVAILALGVALLTLARRPQPAPIRIETPVPTPLPAPSATPAPSPTAGPIFVYVNGAVASPAVYELPSGSRVEQAIQAAGGFTASANADNINLAQPLFDGAQVYVPDRSESATAPVQGLSGQPVEVRQRDPSNQRINLNTASQMELETLPGLGPVLAQRIIDYRQRNGDFPSVEALLEVSGIGDTRLEQLRDLVTVGGG